MKRLLFSLAMIAGMTAMNAQTTIWSDDFEDQNISDWTLLDEDGDGFNFIPYDPSIAQNGEVNYMSSQSYDFDAGPLTPDNWAVSPAIDITGMTNLNLAYLVGAQDPLYADETYTVYVSTGNTIADFEASDVFFSENIGDDPALGEMVPRELDLSSFDGETTIYLAFRHHDSEDMFYINFDDVTVSGGEGGEPDEYCEIITLDCAIEKINGVTFAGIENLNTGCGTAETNDFTDMVANVEIGGTYDMIVDIEADPAFPDDNAFFFIDWNQNGTLDDDGEVYEVVMHTGTSGQYTVAVTVPEGAAVGETRLRVGIAYNSGTTFEPVACPGESTLLYGEYEDYTVSVAEGGTGGEDCNQEVLSNALENGSFLGGDTNQRLAVDITVAANTQMTISGIEPTIIIPEGGEATTFGFVFYADDAGIPGAEVDNAVGNIVSSTITGQNFGRDFIRYELTLDTQVVLEPGTYWMEMTSDAEGWETTTASAIGSALVFSNDSTSGAWVVDGTGAELVYEIVATCETLGVSDMDSFDFAYYPNPVKNELNISSQKSVKSVMVYNLAGQQVSTQKMNQTNGTVNTASLAPGVYIFKALLEGGQVETFKVIKK